MNTNKGFAPIIAIIIAVVIIAGGVGGYLYIKNKNKSSTLTPSTISTSTGQDASTTNISVSSTSISSTTSSKNSPINVKDNGSSTPTFSNPVLEFSAGGCDLAMDPYTEPFEGIISKNWNLNILTINAYAKTLCEGININGSYKLSGTSLALKIDMTHSGPQGECYCARKITYKISNLEQKDYQVSVVRGE